EEVPAAQLDQLRQRRGDRRHRRNQRVAGYEARTLPDHDDDGRQDHGLHPRPAATGIASVATAATQAGHRSRTRPRNHLVMTMAMVRGALALAGKGLHVLPCLPRDKPPATANGLKAATTNPDTIRQWWQQDLQFNIAFATGEPSGIFVVDVDGIDAEAELRKLEAQHGALPPTVEVITARGRHIWIKMPDAPIRTSTVKPAPRPGIPPTPPPAPSAAPPS